ncbi:PREDICTED: uncharacterized protein LOC107351543 isoform X3 [Acropora digitifera]|uniref:uncharacterized protein LOC107351543 isoform X3 n=1 Tax=Acropora digitifera TaxID=70779 RepID=UPI00077AF0D2|nr:PREDICTED: uncharacterized protein LOC107351543 isoform X3 [Acropora digitifera]
MVVPRKRSKLITLGRVMVLSVALNLQLLQQSLAQPRNRSVQLSVCIWRTCQEEEKTEGFSLENVEVDNRAVPDRDKDKEDDLDGSQKRMKVGVEPSATLAKKPWAAKKQRCAAERVDVMHLPDAKKDRDGFLLENVEVPDRDKDKEDDLDGSQQRMEVRVEPSATLAKPRAARKQRCAAEGVDVTHLPDAKKDRDGFPLENVEVPDRDKDKEDDLDGSRERMEVGVEPSATLAKKPWAAKKKKVATEHVDVMHLPDAEKDRDGFPLENVEIDNRTVPDRDKDKECDLHGSQNTSGAKKKRSAVQHDNVTRLLGEENEGGDRNRCCQKNEEVNNTEQCYKPSTPQAKQQQHLQQQLHFPLQQPASHPRPATTPSLPQFPLRRIYSYPNHALWFFAPEISQSKFQGRTSSNACTFIALLMAKLFSITKNATVNISNESSSLQVWLGILTTAIETGNREHDRVTGGQPINFSVRVAQGHLDGYLGRTRVEEALDVVFTNEDSQVPQSSLSFHLGRLSHENSNIAAFVIVNEMTICFVARGGKLFVLDSHSHFPYGAMVGVSDMSRREAFLATIKQELKLRHNLCSLTFVEFL